MQTRDVVRRRYRYEWQGGALEYILILVGFAIVIGIPMAIICFLEHSEIRELEP